MIWTWKNLPKPRKKTNPPGGALALCFESNQISRARPKVSVRKDQHFHQYVPESSIKKLQQNLETRTNRKNYSKKGEIEERK